MDSNLGTTNPTNQVIVTLSSVDKYYPLERLSLTYDSTDKEILDALQPVLLEDEGVNITEEVDGEVYTVKRVDSSHNFYIFPKSTAGL